MKTLLVTIEYPPFKGGVANYYGNLVEHWPEKEGIFVLNNNEGALLSKKFGPNWLKSFLAVYREVKKNKIDHVLVGHILPLGTVVCLLARFMKFDYSVVIHGMDFDFALRASRKKWLAKKILAKSQKIVCSNSFVAEKVKTLISGSDKKSDQKVNATAHKSFDLLALPLDKKRKINEKVQVVNPGINVKFRALEIKNEVGRIRTKHNLDGKFVLFSVCRLVERKGIDTSIEAVKSLLEKYPNLYYYIAGTGPQEKELKEQVGKIKNIVFLGKISDKKKWSWMSLCDAFVMPSREIHGDYEGFGIVYLEANLMGKAVVAARSGGVGDAVIDYETGIMCDPQSHKDVAGAIDELCASYVLREELGQNGMRRAAEEFTWQEQVGKFYNIISK